MKALEKVINDLSELGIEVIDLEDVHVLGKDVPPFKNLKGTDVEVGGKMIMEIRCVVPIQD